MQKAKCSKYINILEESNTFYFDKTPYLILGQPEESFLTGTYIANRIGSVTDEFNEIKWESSDPSIMEVSNSSFISSSDDRSLTFWLTPSIYKAGIVTITGKTNDGRVAINTISVEPKMKIETDEDKNSVYCTVSINKPDKEYLNSFMNGISFDFETEDDNAKNNTKSYIISDDNLSATYEVKFNRNLSSNINVSFKSSSGQVATSIFVPPFHSGIISITYRSDGSKWKGNVFGCEKSGNATHDFYYDDAFFYKDNTKYNNSLAVMSLGLELSSFSSPKYEYLYTETLRNEQRAENINNVYQKLGFDNIAYYNYDKP